MLTVPEVLDIVPLRSLVAVATYGGMHRAARALHFTQAAISRHVQRLEDATGTTLIERDGRGLRFTTDGEQLLRDAERILDAHDSALARFRPATPPVLTVGSMDHAADQLLPDLAHALAKELPTYRVQFRIGRSARLRDAIESGALDVAIVFDGLTTNMRRRNSLPLCWLAATDWRPSGTDPIPLVLFEDHCSLRRAAVETLDHAGIRYRVAAESPDLAGIHSAVRSGLGITLLPDLGQMPDRMIGLPHLPIPPRAALTVRTRRGLPDAPDIRAIISRVVAQTLLLGTGM
jgi:DNA-binding transcriptional LysR family regulator